MVNTKKVAASELTIGDVVILEEGDNVPADIRLLKSYDLMVDESALTGESKPSKKDEISYLKMKQIIWHLWILMYLLDVQGVL